MLSSVPVCVRAGGRARARAHLRLCLNVFVASPLRRGGRPGCSRCCGRGSAAGGGGQESGQCGRARAAARVPSCLRGVLRQYAPALLACCAAHHLQEQRHPPCQRGQHQAPATGGQAPGRVGRSLSGQGSRTVGWAGEGGRSQALQSPAHLLRYLHVGRLACCYLAAIGCTRRSKKGMFSALSLQVVALYHELRRGASAHQVAWSQNNSKLRSPGPTRPLVGVGAYAGDMANGVAGGRPGMPQVGQALTAHCSALPCRVVTLLSALLSVMMSLACLSTQHARLLAPCLPGIAGQQPQRPGSRQPSAPGCRGAGIQPRQHGGGLPLCEQEEG